MLTSAGRSDFPKCAAHCISTNKLQVAMNDSETLRNLLLKGVQAFTVQ